ncbi:hypothetical protein RND81_02G147000 [Saponaria officinalis]|uniref:Uncharacterized protein n=1 Tax=Saponaria officinalis TaxID=3572 RepID=A0AAW1MM65_SAPOF
MLLVRARKGVWTASKEGSWWRSMTAARRGSAWRRWAKAVSISPGVESGRVEVGMGRFGVAEEEGESLRSLRGREGSLGGWRLGRRWGGEGEGVVMGKEGVWLLGLGAVGEDMGDMGVVVVVAAEEEERGT